MKETLDQEKFIEILYYAYKLGNGEADLKIAILIEEIKKKFEETLEKK